MENEYLERARIELERAKKKRDVFHGECKDCQHRIRGLTDKCGHPIVQIAKFNRTDGADKRFLDDCSEQRDVSSMWGPVLCGPNGALFEQREGLLYWAKRFLAGEAA